MAVDTLDLSILVAIVAVLVAIFTKGKLWAVAGGEDIGAGGSSGSRDIVKTLNETGKKVLVLFGSQTGTAEDYAHKFAKEFQARFSLPTMCGDLADYDYDNLDKLASQVSGFQMVIFFAATYGEGEPTDNAIDFFDYLDEECDDLSGLKFAVFGLGNYTYEFFNASGKRIVKTLTEKNAELVGELGLGDDGRGTMDEDYLAWKDSLFEVLKNTLSLDEKDAEYEAAVAVTEDDALTAESTKVALGEPDAKYVNAKSATGPYGPSHPFLAPVIKSRDLCPTRHCIHAELDLFGSKMKYITGDHLAIWPSNSDAKVAKVLSVLGLNVKEDTVIRIKSLDPTVKTAIPSPTTYGAVIRHYLEISGPVSRQFLNSVIQFAPDAETKQRVKDVAGDKTAFQKQITDKGLNIADALEVLSKGAKWSSIPFSFVVESIPHLQPRYYSISSSSLGDEDVVHVTAMVEANEVASVPGRMTTGVTSNLLWNIESEQNNDGAKLFEKYDLAGPRDKFAKFKLPVHVRHSTFKLPFNPDTPIIMVGPGTGVAPFRGFVREKVKQAIVGGTTAGTGKVVLFYGCRNSSEDFLYKNEWPGYAQTLGDRFEMITAFSRESEKKVYVQHKMLEHSKEIADLLSKGAFFYVCGDASKMARDVQKALVEIIAKENHLNEEDAADMVSQLKVQNRYQEDIW